MKDILDELTFNNKKVNTNCDIFSEELFIKWNQPGSSYLFDSVLEKREQADRVVFYLLTGNYYEKGNRPLNYEYDFTMLARNAGSRMLDSMPLFWLCLREAKEFKHTDTIRYTSQILTRLAYLIERLLGHQFYRYKFIIAKFALMNIDFTRYYGVYELSDDKCKRIYPHNKSVKVFKECVAFDRIFSMSELRTLRRVGIDDSATLAIIGNCLYNYVTEAIISLYQEYCF